jgi:hypothetical protein
MSYEDYSVRNISGYVTFTFVTSTLMSERPMNNGQNLYFSIQLLEWQISVPVIYVFDSSGEEIMVQFLQPPKHPSIHLMIRIDRTTEHISYLFVLIMITFRQKQ